MQRDYKRLGIESFGRHLIESGDLDPVYIALNKMEWPEEQLHRWLVTYWCFYHCGVASYLCGYEGDDFLAMLYRVAINKEPPPTGGRWPRGSERRHARGEQARAMIDHLGRQYDCRPEEMVSHILEVAPSYTDVDRRVKSHVLFGPWISFKIADMIDRCLETKVDFSRALMFMFNDPTKAALMLWRHKQGLPEGAKPKQGQLEVVLGEVVDYLINEFKDMDAPPLADRPIGFQEVETVLCKWKSHVNGHYPLYNDIDEIRAGLLPWTEHSEAAREFLHNMPTGSTPIESYAAGGKAFE